MTVDNELVLKVIREDEDGWCVYDHSGKKKLGGPYATKVQAQRQLRQAEEAKGDDDDEADVKKWLEDLRKFNDAQPRDKIGRWTSGGATAARAVGRGVAATGRGAGRAAQATGKAIKPTVKVLGKVALVGAIAGVYVTTTYHAGSATQTAAKLDSDVLRILQDKPPRGASHVSAHVQGNKIKTGFAGKQSDFASIRSHFTVDGRGTAQAQSVADASRNTGRGSDRGTAYTSSYTVDSSGRATPNTNFLRKADDGVLITMPIDGFDQDEFVKAVVAAVVAKEMLEEFRKAAGRKRGGGGAQQAYDSRGRYTSGGVGAAASAVGRAVRGKVNRENAKKVARATVRTITPIVKLVGKAAFTGAMAGLVLGVEQTFSGAGSDVGRASGAAATALAKSLKTKAESKADVFVTAKVSNKGGGTTGVRVQPTQRVDPKASSFDLSGVSGGSSSRSSGPQASYDWMKPGSITTSPYLIGGGGMVKSIEKADDDFSDSDIWVVMPLDTYNEDEFAAAVTEAASTVRKNALWSRYMA